MAKKPKKGEKGYVKPKTSLITKGRGVVYVAAFGAKAIEGGIATWQNPKAAAQIAKSVGRNYTFRDHNTGKFSLKHGAETYAPIAIWSVVDWSASKVGIWKRIGNLIKK